MDFGEALKAIKEGKLVRRKGWNGKGMHIYLEDMMSFPERSCGAKRIYEAVICMHTVQKTHQPGWLASQADMLAEDWEVVEAAA